MNNSPRDSVETAGENACCTGIIEVSKLAVYSQACTSKSFIEHVISASFNDSEQLDGSSISVLCYG